MTPLTHDDLERPLVATVNWQTSSHSRQPLFPDTLCNLWPVGRRDDVPAPALASVSQKHCSDEWWAWPFVGVVVIVVAVVAVVVVAVVAVVVVVVAVVVVVVVAVVAVVVERYATWAWPLWNCRASARLYCRGACRLMSARAHATSVVVGDDYGGELLNGWRLSCCNCSIGAERSQFVERHH